MPDIKVEKDRYYSFLKRVEKFAGGCDDVQLSADRLQLKDEILQYVSIELELRELMEERKRYYDAYMDIRKMDSPSDEMIRFGKEAYATYKKADERINAIRRKENAWKDYLKTGQKE